MVETCPGLNECNRKTCVEQDQCVHLLNQTLALNNRTFHYLTRQKGPKKKKENKEKEPRKELCQMHKKFCTNIKACDILGECILQHPLVASNKAALNQLRGPKEMPVVIRVIERLKPRIKKIGRRRFDKR